MHGARHILRPALNGTIVCYLIDKFTEEILIGNDLGLEEETPMNLGVANRTHSKSISANADIVGIPTQ